MPLLRRYTLKIFMATERKTMPGETEETTPQRGATRAPVKRPVRLQFDDAVDVVGAQCHNVSIGGMFVHSNEGRPVGSLVRFELGLGGEMSIRGLAEVVWMRSQDLGPERVAGMGLKFRFLEQRDRQLIFKLVSQHIKERLAARHPGLGDDQAEAEVEAPPPIRAAASTMERVSAPVARPAEAPRPAGHSTAPPSALGDQLPAIDELVSSDEVGEEPRIAVDAEPDGDDSGRRSLLFDGSAQSQDDEFGTVSETASPAAFDSEPYDDGHFEHRPRPRRDVPVLTLVAVLVTVLAVSAYLWGDRLFDGGADEVAPAPLAEGMVIESDPAAADPATSDPAVPDAAEAAPLPPPATKPPPRARAQTSSAAPARPFRTVRDITARVAGPAVEIVITTDGSVDASRFSYARLPDGAPRELIRLRGLTERFETEAIPVGIGAVRQVRTGWHRKSSGNELHVVIDLANASAQITDVRVEGSRIIATIIG